MLLSTADDLMNTHSWKPTTNVCITGSNSLEQPENWFAQTAHRFYKSEAPEYTSFLAFISILFCDTAQPAHVPEPILTGGWFDYGAAGDVDKHWYSYARFHIWMPDARTDGIVRSTESSTWPKWKLPFSRLTTLAIPLVDVSTADVLKRRVVTPLVAAMTASVSPD